VIGSMLQSAYDVVYASTRTTRCAFHETRRLKYSCTHCHAAVVRAPMPVLPSNACEVHSIEQEFELVSAQLDGRTVTRRPFVFAFLQPFVPDRQSVAVPDDWFDPIGAFTAEYKSPDHGLLPSASAIVAHRPSNERRISTGFTAMKMRAPLGSLSIGQMPARVRRRQAHRPRAPTTYSCHYRGSSGWLRKRSSGSLPLSTASSMLAPTFAPRESQPGQSGMARSASSSPARRGVYASKA
jgi:hypothetical protein